MTLGSIRIAIQAVLAAGLLASTWPGEDAGAQTTPTGARQPVDRAPINAFSVRPLPPPPPGFDILVAFPGDPEESKKCTSVLACDDLIAQCYADADNPGDWACHEENGEGQCSTGTCIFP